MGQRCVMPMKMGIHSKFSLAHWASLDSRIRGNDGGWHGSAIRHAHENGHP